MMKQLKDQAKKDKQQILADDRAITLKEELHEQVDMNLEDLRTEMRAPQKRMLVRSVGIASSACILLTLSIVVGVVLSKHDGYSATYSNKISDISTLNENLKNTQMRGEFKTITLTYEVQHGTPEYFVIIDEQEVPDVSHRDTTIHIVVDRDFSELKKGDYFEEFEFLGYTLLYKETRADNISPDGTGLYGYKAEAFMDTGFERYFIEYYEYCVEPEFTFTEYLEATIKQK